MACLHQHMKCLETGEWKHNTLQHDHIINSLCCSLSNFYHCSVWQVTGKEENLNKQSPTELNKTACWSVGVADRNILYVGGAECLFVYQQTKEWIQRTVDAVHQNLWPQFLTVVRYRIPAAWRRPAKTKGSWRCRTRWSAQDSVGWCSAALVSGPAAPR